MENNTLAISQKLLNYGEKLAVEYGNISVTVRTDHDTVILPVESEDKREEKMKLHNGRGVGARARRKIRREEERSSHNEREETAEGTESDSIQPVPQQQQPVQQQQQPVQQQQRPVQQQDSAAIDEEILVNSPRKLAPSPSRTLPTTIPPESSQQQRVQQDIVLKQN